MVAVTLRKVLPPLALLGLSVGAYFLVLGGVVSFGQEAGVILTAIAGVATIGAVSIREKTPTITAGMATLGFALGVTMSGFTVTVAAALTVLGSIGFLVSTVHSVGVHAYDTSPA